MRRIWSIYYGSRGAAGYYIDSLQRSFQSASRPSYAFVSFMYKYRTSNIIKIFFPVTDRYRSRNIIVKCVRYIELLVAYINILIVALFLRPIIIFNLIDDLYLSYLFINISKMMGLSVYVTCHDVMPHEGNINKRRLSIFRKADRLIVHSDYARNILLNTLPEQETVNKIIKLPFPSSSNIEILSEEKLSVANDELNRCINRIGGKNYFLFIGVVRRSKGVELLLDAWSKFKLNDKYGLIIAGRWAGVEKTEIETRSLPNCILIDKYLSDEEFVVFIKNAKFIVLPYMDYAHSGILLSCLHLDADMILSDIDLFKEMLPEYPLIFRKGDVNQLLNALQYSTTLPEEYLARYRKINHNNLISLEVNLIKSIKTYFS